MDPRPSIPAPSGRPGRPDRRATLAPAAPWRGLYEAPRDGAPARAGTGRGAMRCERIGEVLAAALAGGALVAAAAADHTRHEAAAMTFVILACSGLAIPEQARWSRLLPFMWALPLGAGTLIGLAVLAAASVGTGAPGVGAGVLVAVLVVQAPARALARALVGRLARRRPIRLAVIGGHESTEMLRRELRLAGTTRYLLVGRIGRDGGEVHQENAPDGCLGALPDIETLVRRHEIDLMLMTADCGRMEVFEAFGSCLHLPVRLVALSSFYEETFGHVPAAEINAAWFQYIVHPSYRGPSMAAKRALDITGAVLIGLPFLMFLGIVAPLIRRDGGPVFFWQMRVGEGGRPLQMCKLRTMRVGSAASWAAPDDPRVTPVGRFLRRTHLDELPQLLHVLRGEMSLVGPRPEQPQIVAQLERDMPFYSSRHLIRPGIAGWAQMRCGYAGSEVGSAWKLCHDLYYLKHRSLAFDLAILGETLRTLFVDTQRVPEPTATWFILGHGGSALNEMQPAGPVDQPLPASGLLG